MFAFFSYDPRSATVDWHNTRLAMNGMRQAIVLLWICEKWSREDEHVLVFTGLFGFCYLMYKKCNEFLGTLKIIHIMCICGAIITIIVLIRSVECNGTKMYDL